MSTRSRATGGRPVLCLDFDGVIHSYTSGWQGAAVIPDPPVAGALEFIERAVSAFSVAIYSSRSHQPGGREAMRAWLKMHFAAKMEHGWRDAELLLSEIAFPDAKPSAFVGIDDRQITFTGAWPAIAELQAFTPWNKRPPLPEPNGGGGPTATLMANARKLIHEVKAQHLLGAHVEEDRMLAFAFADALIGLLPGSGEWASIEARAKAICNAPGLHPYAPQWDDLTESERDDFRKLAEAEMREKHEPTLGEREACAKVADEVAAELKGGALLSPAIGYGETVAVRIAAAIRARGAPA